MAAAESGAAAGAHWSLQPLRPMAVPVPENTRWVRTPIDAFILAELEARGLQPSPSADRSSLLRRVHFDLIGLPPTPEEQAAFLRDPSPTAYEKVVDRLLASPRYGERWARHWMDAVHFAETHGNDQDRIRTNAWPYRDYLVRAFNTDRPYARFVQEQVAGDVLFPDDPQATVALGFLAAGPWDESSLRDIREETTDRQVARYLDRDDVVTTVMQTFASTTVQCARCHDHKFDPVSQADYYNLQAVFAGVDRAERFFDEDPRIHAARQRLLRDMRLLERKDPAFLASLLAPEPQGQVSAWELAQASTPIAWTVLTPISAVSSNGSTLTVQPDGSVLAGGVRPETDTYVLTVSLPDGAHWTALRLEALADDRLPLKGPGRQDNGNFHLSEWSAHHEAPGGELRPLSLLNPTADFNQAGWTVAHSLDGNRKTAWGIYPQVGQPHQAVVEFPQPLPITHGAVDRLVVVLEQKHGGGHLLGRVRLSATSATPPVRLQSWPEAIARVLAKPSDRRSQPERVDLAAFYWRERIKAELATLPAPRRVYAAASDYVPDGGLVPVLAPRRVQILKRGDINRPGDDAQPGSLSCVPSLPSRFSISDPLDEGARRAALAGWLVDPRNPLTWRSIVNRVWRYHFGRGLVDTPNDFGRMGGRPSHPQLLDWMAIRFRETGGSIKELHRLLVTSAVYRQQSDAPRNPAGERAQQIDADNRLLWRMHRARLDAESIRDAILQISGRLDLRMGGPSDQQFGLSPGIHVTPVVDYGKFDPDSDLGRRRSVYRFIFRTLPDPFMDSMDCPAGDQLAATRGESVTALQALSMLNNAFVVRQSEHFARRVESMTASSAAAQATTACQLALGRMPSRPEKRRMAEFVEQHGLANLCRVLFNSNEFIFVQ